MTKIYVVKVANLEEKAMCVSKVFTNRKKAEAFRDYFNLTMDKYHYWITSYQIENDDYTSILQDLKKKRGQ